IVVGFRRDGSASFFFGADPVYQFNSAGELRRAYIGGLLYKAERGRLISLRRQRTAAEVALVRTELQPNEADALLTTTRADLARLNEALISDRYALVGQVPQDGNALERIRQWLANLPPQISVASKPHA